MARGTRRRKPHRSTALRPTALGGHLVHGSQAVHGALVAGGRGLQHPPRGLLRVLGHSAPGKATERGARGVRGWRVGGWLPLRGWDAPSEVTSGRPRPLGRCSGAADQQRCCRSVAVLHAAPPSPSKAIGLPQPPERLAVALGRREVVPGHVSYPQEE